MTSRLYVQKRGPSGGTDIEFTAFTGRKGTPFFDGNTPLVQLGMRYEEGEASQGTFLVTDPTAEMAAADFSFNLPAHALVTWTEDDPGSEIWLSRGRIAGSDSGRGGVIVVDDEKEHEVVVDDCNVDLRGQAFTSSWVRPAETDYQRLVALQAYTLNGASSTATYHRDTCDITISSTHLAPNTATVNMPAKKYLPGTQPADVIRDCAEMAAKFYGVVIHHTGGSHLCLLYILSDNHSTYSTAAKISDDVADWDPEDLTAPVWEPHWEMGKATIGDGQTLLSGLVTTYGPETAVFNRYALNEESYDYWVEAYSDGKSTTSSQASTRGAALLDTRKLSHLSHRVSVIALPDQVDLLAAGMSIQIKASAAMGGAYLDTWQTRRIAELQWEPRTDGRYWAHMHLDRPVRSRQPSGGAIGPLPPVQSEPATATSLYLWTFDANNKDTTNTYPVGTLAQNWHAGFVHTHVTDPAVGNRSASPYPPLGPGTYTFRAIYDRADGSPYNSGGIRINVYEVDGATNPLVGQTALSASYPEFEDSIQVTLSGSALGFAFEMPYNNSNIREVEMLSGTFDAFVGTPAPPAATDSTGAIGTSAIYAPADHQHPAQSASVTPIQDDGTFFDAAYVEGALQELAARAWKIPVRVATTAAGTLATSFENGDSVDGVTLATGDRILLKNQAAGAENGIYKVAASGAPTRATDFDTGAEALGAAVFVSEGTTNGNKVYVCTTNATITIGSTTLVFAEVSGSGGTLIVQEDDSTVDAAATTLDFTTALNVTSSPSGEANIAVDLGTGSTQAAAGDHTHDDGDSSKASASSELTATTGSAADITGATLSLAEGIWIVIGVFDVTVKSNSDRLFEGILDVGGSDENDLATLQGVGLDTDDRANISQVWRITLGGTTTVKLQARHSGGSAGDFTVNDDNTTITAYKVGAVTAAAVTTDLLSSTKASADTPDDEFPGTSLDGKWTVVDGSAGSVSLLGTSGAGVYEVGERDGWLSMMLGTASGDSVVLRQDYTLPDGNSIVAAMAYGIDNVASLSNNEILMGIGVNDNDGGIYSGATGQTLLAIMDTQADAARFIALEGSADPLGSTPGADISEAAAVGLFFVRIDRDGLNYHAFFSMDGWAWGYLGVKTMSTAANNVWLFATCEATMANRVTVGCAWFRQGTALSLDPWPL